MKPVAPRDVRGVARVGRRGVRGHAAYEVRVLVVLAVLVGLVMLAGAGPVQATIALTVLAVGWCAVAVGVIVMIPRTLEALAGMTALADKGAWKADRVRMREAGWSVDSAASVERTGGMLLVRNHLLSVVPPGGVVLLQAATAKHARVYERLGCQPLASQPLKLTYRVPTASRAGLPPRPITADPVAPGRLLSGGRRRRLTCDAQRP